MVECETCGRYYVPEQSRLWLEYPHQPPWGLTKVQRAVLAHEKCLWDSSPTNVGSAFTIDQSLLSRIRDHGRLPSRAEQAANLTRFVGDYVSRNGEPVRELPDNIHTIIGAVSPESANELAQELVRKLLFTAQAVSPVMVIGLTIEGWERYEDEQQGRFHGNYGFLAMKFDDELDGFIRNVVKPAVKDATGYELKDLRDVSKAGLIDNLMVTTIRDARFVIVDLTHDNRGAYWEAGYAEGLGKPVVYICNREKFEDSGTHFDTNHYTTVLWMQNDVDSFRQELAATLRRSLADIP